MDNKSFACGLAIGIVLSFTAWYIVFFLKPMFKEWWEDHKRAKSAEIWKRIHYRIALDVSHGDSFLILQQYDKKTLADGSSMEVELINSDTYYFSITTKDKDVVKGKVDRELFERMLEMPLGCYIRDNLDTLPDVSATPNFFK